MRKRLHGSRGLSGHGCEEKHFSLPRMKPGDLVTAVTLDILKWCFMSTAMK
jgi:hypothetical protein